MGRLFEKQLDVLLEDSTLFAAPVAKARELADVESQAETLKSELRQELDTLLNRLSLEIRKRSQALTTTQGRDGLLRVTYRNFRNGLSIRPDLESHRYIVGSTPFEREFLKANSYKLNLGPEVVAEAVVEHFKTKYKSIK